MNPRSRICGMWHLIRCNTMSWWWNYKMSFTVHRTDSYVMKKCGRMFGGNICCGGGRCVTCNAGVIGSIDLPGTHISSGELALHLQAQPQPPFTDNCDAVFPHLTRNATYIARKDYHWPHISVFIAYLFWKRLRHPISYRNSNLENNLFTLFFFTCTAFYFLPF